MAVRPKKSASVRSRYATLETHILKNQDSERSHPDDLFVISGNPAGDRRVGSGVTPQATRGSDSLYTPVSSGGFSDNSYATRARSSSSTPAFSSFTSTLDRSGTSKSRSSSSSTRSMHHTRVEAQPRDMWGNPAFLDDLEVRRNQSRDKGGSRRSKGTPSSSGKRRSSGTASRSGSSRRASSTASGTRSAARGQSSRSSARQSSYSRHEYARERRSNNLVSALALPRPRIFDRLTVRSARIIAIVVVVAALALMIYPAARELFISQRDLERANIELTEVNNRNQQIQDDINTIKTDEGVESYVREQFGWVKEGETAVTVTGVPSTSESESLLMPEDVNASEVKPKSNIFTGAPEHLLHGRRLGGPCAGRS